MQQHANNQSISSPQSLILDLRPLRGPTHLLDLNHTCMLRTNRQNTTHVPENSESKIKKKQKKRKKSNATGLQCLHEPVKTQTKVSSAHKIQSSNKRFACRESLLHMFSDALQNRLILHFFLFQGLPYELKYSFCTKISHLDVECKSFPFKKKQKKKEK